MGDSEENATGSHAHAVRHTPGPWDLRPHDPAIVVADGIGFSPPYRLRPGSGVCPRQLADARLIAAAPDLLAALEAVLAAHDEVVAVWGGVNDAEGSPMANARAAIAKARGEQPHGGGR